MHDAQPLQNLAKLKQASLNQRDGNRIPVTLEGYCSINGGDDVACTTIDISMSGVSLATSANPEVGDLAKLSLSQIGLLQGRVARLLANGFAIEFDDTLSSKVIRVVNRLRHGSTDTDHRQDGRENARIIPLKKLARVTRADGTEFHSRIIDLSRSGIALNNMRGLVLEERVTIGQYRGVVARCLPGGAAIEFDQALPVEDFDIVIEFA